MENPIKIYDLGAPPFLETPLWVCGCFRQRAIYKTDNIFYLLGVYHTIPFSQYVASGMFFAKTLGLQPCYLFWNHCSPSQDFQIPGEMVMYHQTGVVAGEYKQQRPIRTKNLVYSFGTFYKQILSLAYSCFCWRVPERPRRIWGFWGWVWGGWGGGMITFLALVHMLNATQQDVSRTCTHVECYATGCFSRTCTHVEWYATGCFSRTCTHVECYATGCFSRTCTHVECYATGCFSRTCTHVECYATGCFSRTCTHVWCYATCVGWVGWGDDNVPCTCAHVECYATGCFSRTCTHVECYATGCFSRTCTHVECYATGCFSRTCTHVECYATGCFSRTCTHVECYATGCFSRTWKVS